MVDKGANVNVTDSRGMTPLMRAAEWGKSGICEVLLSSEHIDIEAKDDRGETALMKATKRRRMDIVKLLKKHGQAESEDPS
jgi:ankyrin repeat protein